MVFRVLGPFEASDGTTSVRLGGPKQRALLARLLLDAPRTVAVGRLVDDLWGDEPPETAVKIVRIYVSHLRKVLPAGVLRTTPPGYQLVLDDHDLDLHRVDRLRTEARVAIAERDVAEPPRA